MTQPDSSSMQPGRYAQANGLNIYYEEHGNGLPLILLHGGTGTLSMWQPQIPALAQHFRVIAPDSRGHGRTDNPTGQLSYWLMADDIAAFIQSLGLTRPLVCGYSDGGQIALEIGMRYPGLTAALVVGAAWYRFSETYLNVIKSLGFEGPGVMNIEQIEKVAPDTVRQWQAEHSRPNDSDYWQTLLKQISTMWWTPLDYTAEDFHKISEPVLVLIGDRDGIIEIEQAFEMYRLIPNAELAILPNTTHMSAISATSNLLTEVALDFLLRHSVVAS